MTLSKEQIESFSFPLLERNGKDNSKMCLDYYEAFRQRSKKKDQQQAKIWLLFSYLLERKKKIPKQFSHITQNDARLKKIAIFYSWLCEIYDFTMKKAEKSKDDPFHFFRAGNEEKFLQSVKNYNKTDEWKTLTFSGAFSSAHFKIWSETVFRLVRSKSIPNKEKDLYLALAGDLDSLLARSPDSIDKIWAHVYSTLANAMCDKEYLIDFSKFPKSSSDFIQSAIDILHDIFEKKQHPYESLCHNNGINLSFRVHVAAVLNASNLTQLVQEYIEKVLLPNNLLGLIVFYASLTKKEDSILILSDILAALDPTDELINVLESFNISPEEVVCGIVNRLCGASLEDFEQQIDLNEFREQKIKCLDWFAIVPSLRDKAIFNARKIIRSMVLNDDYMGAKQVFDRFQQRFPSNREARCWEILLFAELEYQKWQSENDNNLTDDLKVILKNVLRFPGGWMKQCPDVDSEIGKHCIPLIANQLIEVLIEINEIQQALGVSSMICDSGNLIYDYFDKKDLMSILVKLKTAAIKGYRMNFQASIV